MRRARCGTWEKRDGVILEMLNGNLIGGPEIEAFQEGIWQFFNGLKPIFGLIKAS
jgi:hypothetical protein